MSSYIQFRPVDDVRPRYYHRDGSYFTDDVLEWARSKGREVSFVAETPVGRYFLSTIYLGGVDFNVMSSIYPYEAEPLLFETVLFDELAVPNDRMIKQVIKHHTELEAIRCHTRLAGILQGEFALPSGR